MRFQRTDPDRSVQEATRLQALVNTYTSKAPRTDSKPRGLERSKHCELRDQHTYCSLDNFRDLGTGLLTEKQI
jgi:hypothetical protein